MTSDYFELSFHSSQPGEAEQYLADLYGRVSVQRELVGLDQDVAGDDRFQLAAGRFDGSYTCLVDINQFTVSTATTAAPWEEADDHGDMHEAPAVFRPGTPYTAYCEDTEVRVASFDPGALQRTARLLYGRPELELTFQDAQPATPRASTTWLSVLDLARQHQHSGLLREDLVRASLYRLLAVTALDSFRIEGDRAELHASAERLSRIHAVATTFFHDFASLPITIDDAAEAAGASIPELITAFRGHDLKETRPTTYLRNVRLAAALDDLRAADPTLGDTVAEIGQRWGFRSPSRFAAHFRAAYGVNPKHVLDR